MAASRGQCFSAIFAILLVFFVFVAVTSAQITFNRQWRRGKYPSEDKADMTGESDEFTFDRVTKSEHPESALHTIARFANKPTSIILSANVLGEIWKGSKNLPSAPYQMQPPIVQVPMHWKMIRSNGPLRLSHTFI